MMNNIATEIKKYSKSELALIYGVDVRTIMKKFYCVISPDDLKRYKYKKTDKIIYPVLVQKFFDAIGKPNS